MAGQAIATRNLCRVYQTHTGLWRRRAILREALSSISLEVQCGEVFGLLGPNGAGKTTLVKILSTVLLPTSGEAFVLGYDVQRQVHDVRCRIGIVFGGERGLYVRLTARQSLFYWAALYRLDRVTAQKRISRLVDLVGLTERADDRVENYSRGMKQRLHLARGLINDPALLFLDEPTIGLDPVASLSVRNIIQELQEQGVTVFLTTHYMQEAEELCDRVAFINDGRIIQQGTPQALSRVAAASMGVEAVVPASSIWVADELQRLPSVGRVSVEGSGTNRTLHIHLQDANVARVLGLLGAAGATRVITKEPTLQDVYLHLLGDRRMMV